MYYSIVSLVFCLLMGVSIANFGWWSLLWTSVGFAVGVFAASQMALPILIGVPKAIIEVAKGRMRAGVIAAQFVTPAI